MLYKKLITITIATCAFLTKPIFGATYRATDTGVVDITDITCTGGSSSTCNIYCDKEGGLKSKNIDCNNVGTCNFYCEQKKCADSITLTATNSNTLNVVVGVNGEECFKSVSVYTPQYGDATFDMGQSKKGFKGMKVYAGEFATNITIDIPGNTAYGDDVKEMEIYASTADFVSISMDNGLEWQDGILECPVNSPYNGPEIAPCMLDAGTNAILNNLVIDAPDGTPKGVWVTGGHKPYTETIISCDCCEVSNFNTGNNCWNTLDPTTDPTINPTPSPTHAPTKQPTPSATKQPTPAPTKHPTHSPIEPTNNPGISPSDDPTYSPTDSRSVPDLITTSPTTLIKYSTTALTTNIATATPIKHGNVDEIYTTDKNEYTSNKNELTTNDNKQSNILIYIILTIGSILCFCFLCMFVYHKNKNIDIVTEKSQASTPTKNDDVVGVNDVLMNGMVNEMNGVMIVTSVGPNVNNETNDGTFTKNSAHNNSDDEILNGVNTLHGQIHGENDYTVNEKGTAGNNDGEQYMD